MSFFFQNQKKIRYCESGFLPEKKIIPNPAVNTYGLRMEISYKILNDNFFYFLKIYVF